MHKFMNTKKTIEIANKFWDKTYDHGLMDIAATYLGQGEFLTANGHHFTNMCSYSYLGLDSHPEIISGAINEIQSSKIFNYSITRIRIILDVIKETEELLGKVFEAQAITLASCSAASLAILPLIASGIFTDNEPPIMVFDKYTHFSINIIKPICADESEVLTIAHNDLNALEEICKTHKNVVYVAEGIYSTGGCAPVRELRALQDKYGLFLVFDEAHSISVYGKNGRGYALEEMGGINNRTIIVSSLNKGFGAYGGLLLLGPGINRKIVERFGGPIGWSGSDKNNTAVFGAIKASAKIHLSTELTNLQAKLQENIKLFDSLVNTKDSGDKAATRFIQIGDPDRAIEIAKNIFTNGYYTSPLFFPIVPKGQAGLRVMIRADLKQEKIKSFCKLVNSAIH